LTQFAFLFEPDPDDPEYDPSVSRSKISVEELKRETEREKLRELKKRKISGCGGLGLPSTQRGRIRGPSGVFVRRDVQDESAEVDVDVPLDQDIALGQALSLSATPMEMDLRSPLSRPSPLSRTVSPPTRNTPRIRRPSTKLQATQASANGTPTKTAGIPPRTKRKRDPSTEPELNPTPVPATGKHMAPDRKRDIKPKSETYKQSWSISEQHLLEQLLEQIPDGEKNRWVSCFFICRG